MIEKQIQINGRAVAVKELTVGDVYDLWLHLGADVGDPAVYAGHMERLLEKATGLTGRDFLPLYFSDAEAIWDAVVEVNASFFGLARKLGLSDLVEAGRTTTCAILNAWLTDLSSPATARRSGGMA